MEVSCDGAAQIVMPGAEFARVRSEALKLIQGMLDEELVPGLSIALVSSEGAIWLEGFGQADAQSATPASPDTVYRTGSLSKPLTALAVMQLTKQRKIDLDKPLARQLPGFSIRRRDDDLGPARPAVFLTILRSDL